MNIDLSTIDPNIVYLLLVFGLWASITAVYVSGTMILEGAALVGVGISLVALVQAEANWLAVMILIVGASVFMVTPFIKQQYASLTVVGLALQGVGGLFLFRQGESVSVFIIALTLLILFGYNQFALVPLLERIRSQPVADRDSSLVGMRGRVVKRLDPIGTVHVNGELWTASLEEDDTGEPPEPADAGEQIVVVERNGLQLIVQPVKRKRHVENNREEVIET